MLVPHANVLVGTMDARARLRGDFGWSQEELLGPAAPYRQDAEYAAAERYDDDHNEEERQREAAEQAIAGPIQVEAVRAARIRRLDTPTSGRGTTCSPVGGIDRVDMTPLIGDFRPKYHFRPS